MDIGVLRTGEKIAAAAGIVLLLAMFIFNWFSYEGVGGNAWEVFGLIDIILFITALAAIALAVMSMQGAKVDLPIAMSAIVAGLGILSLVLLLFRLISPPDVDLGPFGDLDASRSIGLFIGILAAAGVAYGGWTAMQEEGTSFTDQRDRFGGPGGGAPGAGPGGPNVPTPPPPPGQ